LDRTILKSREGRSLWCPKISSSGWKVEEVPRRFGAAPSVSSGPRGMPAREALLVEHLVPRHLHHQRIRQAFTTDAPTPWRPPEVS
jgi:hypothetical protein